MDRASLLEAVRNRGSYDFVRSGGPGGQNVNKVNTKVILRIALDELSLKGDEYTRVSRRLANRLNGAGELVIHSSETRSQALNRERAEERAVTLIAEAARPQKKRRPTKPGRAAKERRLERKKARGEKKRLRQDPEE